MNKQVFNADPQPPPSLKSLQEWFASVITTRMGKKDTIQPIIGGLSIAEEAMKHIAPSPFLLPYQRIQIYNQQYWWRLCKILQEAFPIAVRLLGHEAFNEQIAVPYLLDFPPNHWSLNVLGERLPRWVLQKYHKPNHSLVYDSVCLDWAFSASYVANIYAPLDLAKISQENPDELLASKLYLQPHLHLFNFKADLLSFRVSFLKQSVDYWKKHHFPKLSQGKDHFFLLYRNENSNLISWRKISQGEWLLLNRFKEGSSIEDACSYIETLEKKLHDEIAQELQKWIQHWAQSGWLTRASGQLLMT